MWPNQSTGQETCWPVRLTAQVKEREKNNNRICFLCDDDLYSTNFFSHVCMSMGQDYAIFAKKKFGECNNLDIDKQFNSNEHETTQPKFNNPSYFYTKSKCTEASRTTNTYTNSITSAFNTPRFISQLKCFYTSALFKDWVHKGNVEVEVSFLDQLQVHFRLW